VYTINSTHPKSCRNRSCCKALLPYIPLWRYPLINFKIIQIAALYTKNKIIVLNNPDTGILKPVLHREIGALNKIVALCRAL